MIVGCSFAVFQIQSMQKSVVRAPLTSTSLVAHLQLVCVPSEGILTWKTERFVGHLVVCIWVYGCAPGESTAAAATGRVGVVRTWNKGNVHVSHCVCVYV